MSLSLSLRLQTARLELIAATLPLLEAKIAGAVHLGESLQAEVETWPPPLNDENSLRWTFEKLQANPEAIGFLRGMSSCSRTKNAVLSESLA